MEIREETSSMSIAKEESLKIVIIDDSNLSRKTISEILTSENYNVVAEAESAKMALSLVGTVECDLYIIDVVMPKMSGIELAKIINEKNPESSILMISSLNMENIIIESISNGAVDFLIKPFNQKDLLDSVNKINQSKKNQES